MPTSFLTAAITHPMFICHGWYVWQQDTGDMEWETEKLEVPSTENNEGR